MSIKSLNPYLNFDGTAAKAIALYESALGAKADGVMRFGEMPGGDFPAEVKDRIMHARLQVGPGVIMISDTMPGQPCKQGNNVEVIVHYDDAAEMAKAFDALAAGGTVGMAIHDAFWGAKYGFLTDAYGVRWSFHCELPKAS